MFFLVLHNMGYWTLVHEILCIKLTHYSIEIECGVSKTFGESLLVVLLELPCSSWFMIFLILIPIRSH